MLNESLAVLNFELKSVKEDKEKLLNKLMESE